MAADRFGHRTLLIVGLAVVVVADVVLARATTPAHAFVGTAFWGLHMGLTQGLLSKLVADTAPATLRGTAFGVFNLVSGVALLLASVIAGVLWNAVGPSRTFYGTPTTSPWGVIYTHPDSYAPTDGVPRHPDQF